MRVEMTVEFVVEVPDNTDPDSLCVSVDPDSISVLTTSGDVIEDATVEGYETVCVEEVDEDDLEHSQSGFSFHILDLDCPNCGQNLTDKDNVFVLFYDESTYRTCLGLEGPYEGFVMEDNSSDTTLIQDHIPRSIQCANCGHDLVPESIEG